MVKKTEHLKRSVILGYLSILILVVAALIYISNLITRIVREENRDDPAREKAYIITNTLLLLYESETYTQFVNDADDEFDHFNQTLDRALEHLHLLDSCFSDSTQTARISELESLLEQKRENTGLLLIIRQEMDQLYAKHLADGLAAKRSMAKEVGVQIQEETRQNTLLMQRERKGFLKRLAEVFVPEKADTSILTNSTSRIQTDSLVNEYNPSEAISHVLLKIQADINEAYDSLNVKLERQAVELRQNNNVITGEINQILFEIEEEAVEASRRQELLREDLIRNAVSRLGVIAAISLLVILVFLYLILRDIAKGHYYRKQLEVAKQFAEDLLQSREKFMLMISHDIRAPLSSILGYLELLRHKPEGDRKEEYLDHIAAASGHVLSLVNDLLDFHRLESGQIVIRRIPFHLRLLFEEVYAGFKPLTDAKGLSFHLDLSSLREPCVYVGDPIRIRQAVGNLLSNAIKFTAEGSVWLTVASEAEEGDAGQDRLRISVKDEGMGMSEAEQEIVFKEFIRLAGAEKIEGFGLGLSITARLVSLMGGSISLNSRVGEGSEFILSLPLPLSDEAPDSPESCEDAQPVASKRNLHCLVIDDDLAQLKLTEKLLQRHEVNVVTLTSPNDAIALLKSATPFDLILTDIQMPLMDGYALLQRIRSLGTAGADTIPVVALSASLAEEQEHYLAAGFTGFLSKPFTAGELTALLSQLFPEQSPPAEPPLNLTALTAFAEDDTKAAASILQTFAEETQKSITLLQEALESANRPQAARIAHKLIPLFALLEAGELVAQLRTLEANADTLDEAAWRQTLEAAIARTIAAVDQIRVE
jgi:signal transduction histidine kinase/DNA-binding response OmpR family regulator